jgi:hypothetical protein
MSGFKLSKSLMDATPNSSKLAEILLQLKDDGITRLVSNNEPDSNFQPSQQTVCSLYLFLITFFLSILTNSFDFM